MDKVDKICIPVNVNNSSSSPLGLLSILFLICFMQILISKVSRVVFLWDDPDQDQ